ncbi:MAG: glutamyl-tRNA reductase, partial [Halobacteriales archaeon]|nr:glutamyl-tRNA reductase [Halobacteriales archaeon]
MNRPFTITGVRVTHRSASLSTLETAAHDDPEGRLATLVDRDEVAEAFVLDTCNRAEEYVVTEDAAAGRRALSDFSQNLPESAVEITSHEDSLRHLLRVAAGLESQVLGEDQILGQFRTAYTVAEDAGAVGPVLEPALLKAIHVGER